MILKLVKSEKSKCFGAKARLFHRILFIPKKPCVCLGRVGDKKHRLVAKAGQSTNHSVPSGRNPHLQVGHSSSRALLDESEEDLVDEKRIQ